MPQTSCRTPDPAGRSGELDHTLGHIRGTVVDINGNRVAGSRIWIRENARSTYAEHDGNFTMINLNPALYTLIAEAEGFFPCITTDLPIELGDNPGHRIVMHPIVYPERAIRMRGLRQAVPSA